MRVFLLFLVLSGSITSFSQNNKPVTLQKGSATTAGFSEERLARIDKNINDWLKDGRLNGAVALIIRDGKIIIVPREPRP